MLVVLYYILLYYTITKLFFLITRLVTVLKIQYIIQSIIYLAFTPQPAGFMMSLYYTKLSKHISCALLNVFYERTATQYREIHYCERLRRFCIILGIKNRFQLTTVFELRCIINVYIFEYRNNYNRRFKPNSTKRSFGGVIKYLVIRCSANTYNPIHYSLYTRGRQWIFLKGPQLWNLEIVRGPSKLQPLVKTNGQLTTTPKRIILLVFNFFSCLRAR